MQSFPPLFTPDLRLLIIYHLPKHSTLHSQPEFTLSPARQSCKTLSGIFFLNGRIWSIHSIFSKDIRFFLFLAIFSPHVHGISAAVWVASAGLVCSWMMGVLRVLSPIRCLHVLQRLLGLFGVHVVFACPRAEADIEMCTALRAPLLVTWEETKPETRERREETGVGLQLHICRANTEYELHVKQC